MRADRGVGFDDEKERFGGVAWMGACRTGGLAGVGREWFTLWRYGARGLRGGVAGDEGGAREDAEALRMLLVGMGSAPFRDEFHSCFAAALSSAVRPE